MNPTRAAILAGLLMAACASAADWRDHLPADWLLIAEAPDLAALDGLAPALFEPWGRPAPPLRATIDALAPRGAFAPRPWAIAVAPDERGTPTVVAYAPTDDFDALCEAFDADRADDLALANLFGFDVAIEPIDGWARISLLDTPPELDAPGAAPVREAQAAGETLRLTLSPAGCRFLAESLELRRRGQAAGRLRRRDLHRWPNNLQAAIERLAPYAPVAAVVADWEAPLTLAAFREDNGLRLELSAPVAAPNRAPSSRASALRQENAILWLEAPGPLPGAIIDLGLASMASRPDQIEAPEHPQPQWDDFADACRRLLEGCRTLQTVLVLPAEGAPAAANQEVCFTWDDAAGPLGDRLRESVDRWNTMVDAAEARTPLKLELAPLGQDAGYRLRTDLITGTGLEPSPEIEAIFDRYYGAGRWAVTELKPLGGGAWQTAMRPGFAPTAEPRPAEVEPGTLLRGQLRLDRLTAWWQSLDDLMQEDTVGRRVRPPMREAPAIVFRATGGERLLLSARAPLSAYRALAAYYRSEPLPLDDD